MLILGCATCKFPYPNKNIGDKCISCDGIIGLIAESDEPSQLLRNKQKRMKGKEKNNVEYLKHAKQEIRRLEKGIDKVLYHLDTEDLSDPVFWSQIQADLIKLYNGKELS